MTFNQGESDDDMTGIVHGMLDHSKMALCMFMLAVVSFNPFGIALNKLGGSEHDFSGKGRTLLSGTHIYYYLLLLFTY